MTHDLEPATTPIPMGSTTTPLTSFSPHPPESESETAVPLQGPLPPRTSPKTTRPAEPWLSGPESLHAHGRARSQGMDSFSDADLLAILLGKDPSSTAVRTWAASLLDQWGGLEGLGKLGVGGVAALEAVEAEQGCRLAAAFEWGRRWSMAQHERPPTSFRHSRIVDAWARARLAHLDHEELWALSLDGRHGLRAARRVAMGGLHGISVSPRDPLRVVLREGATAFILVHNHPSGDPTPSDEDLRFTRRVEKAAWVVATPLLDHVIVGRPHYYSMLDAGHFSPEGVPETASSIPDPGLAPESPRKSKTRASSSRTPSPKAPGPKPWAE